MTNYYQVIASGIAGLKESSPDSRREFYWLARTELEVQLCGLVPPLTQSEIMRERLALNEAIRKIEAERLLLVETPRLDTAPARPLESPEREASCIGRQLVANAARVKPDSTSQEKREDAGTDTVRAQFVGEFSNSDQEQSQDTTVEVLKVPRGPAESWVAHAHSIKAPMQSFAQSNRSIPQERKPSHKPRPAVGTYFDGIGRRLESPAKRSDMTMPASESTLGIAELRPCPEVGVAPPRPRHQPGEPTPGKPTGGSARALKAFLGVLVTVALALTLYWQRDRITTLFVGSTAMQTQQFGQLWSKASYLIGQFGQLGFSASGQARSSQEFTAVPQKVVLYEEDPAGAQKKRYEGSVVWRTETISPGPGQASELAVKAELEIPERRISMKLSVCRNTDKGLPASHMIEIMFKLPPDFPLGGISNVPSILMKPAEQTPGAPLAGLTVKVISGFFLFGASAAENDMQRNMELLKERAWFDIPIVYNNGRRAVLAIEKGTPGDRAFKQAFVAWGS
jgi:hypothetical protein